jgi:ATP-dependent helicase/nuclease subunit A
VLTHRFLSHLGPQQDAAGLAELIAITFTDRAAREMRERIRAEVQRRLRASQGAEADHWFRILRGLHTARISTIHSFCRSLLAAHAAEAQLDPAFRVLDDVESSNLLLSTIEDELQRFLAEQHPALMRLAVDFDLDRLRKMITNLIRGRQQPWLDEWRDRSVDELLACWEAYHRTVIVPQVCQRLVAHRTTQELLALLREHVPSHPVMSGRRLVLLDVLPRLVDSQSPVEDVNKIIENARVQGGGSANSWPERAIFETVRERCKELRELAEKGCRLLAWDPCEARHAATVGIELLQLVLPIRDAYVQRKRNASALDYDDLLVLARDLLCRPHGNRLRARYAAKIKLLLVDEFQDTDQVQVDLIRALCDNDLASGKLFLVGDLKQSIYRFRGAQPHVFREVRSQIPAAGRLPLARNFRSQPAILRFVNALFRDDMQDYEPLTANRPQLTPEPAIEFLWAPAEAAQEKVEVMRRREADWIARRLRHLLDEQAPIVCRKGTGPHDYQVKPLEQGDIAILFRAMSDVGVYEEALRRYGIDYYLVGGHAFYAQQEVYDLVNLLRAVASPADEVSLAGALRSPFFSVSDDGLFWLAQHPGRLCGGLFAGDLPAELTGEMRARAEFARDTIRDLRAIKDRVSVAELINEALARTGYDAVLLGEFLGERKLANLRKLIEMARSFDRTGLFSLSDFNAQLSEFVVRQPREPLAATQAEATSAVQIMTIHQAKGLEFPLVVVPDLGRSDRQSNDDATFDRALGPLVRSPKSEPGHDALSGYDLYHDQEKQEDAAEMMRLLYVATTRAADYLILSSGVKALGSAGSDWLKHLAQRFDLTTGEPLCPSADEPPPRVLVTSQVPPLAGTDTKTPRPDLAQLVRAAESTKGGRVLVNVDPLPVCSASRRRFSFSQLTGALEPIAEYEDYGPAVETGTGGTADESSPDALRLGTIVHAVLSEIGRGGDFDIAQRVHHHADIELRDDPQLLASAEQLIARFMHSPRAKALSIAPEIHPEIEFLLTWPPGASGPQSSYLQGYIDCLYRDAAGAWHIVDYKTNRVSAAQVARAARQYEMQMLLYAVAAESILGVRPQSLVLHFLQPGVEHEVAFNASARERLTQYLNDAIAALRTPEGAHPAKPRQRSPAPGSRQREFGQSG